MKTVLQPGSQVGTRRRADRGWTRQDCRREIEFMGLQIQSAQYADAYFYWTLPDNSCRRNESRGAAGRPGTDY